MASPAKRMGVMMPYLTQVRRKSLLPHMQGLLELTPHLSKGDINFIICTLVGRKYGHGDYEWRSTGASVIRDAEDEYRRKVMHPYEDKKCKERGDVFETQ